MEGKKLAVLGCGNMGSAIVRGVIEAGVFENEELLGYDVVQEKAGRLEEELGIRAERDIELVVREADIILIAVKPQNMRELLEQLRGLVGKDKLVISIAAGIRTEFIEGVLGEIPVVRVMPNTPALVGEGMAAVCCGRFAGDSEAEIAEKIFGALGKVIRVREEQMDAITALSGSGPAYLFFLIEIMEEAARSLGIEPEKAQLLARQTALGAAKLAVEAGVDARELRRQVTSPGGTTEAAFKVLEEAGVGEIFVRAIQAAARRSEELSRL